MLAKRKGHVDDSSQGTTCEGAGHPGLSNASKGHAECDANPTQSETLSEEVTCYFKSFDLPRFVK